jgi:hypothetical protein
MCYLLWGDAFIFWTFEIMGGVRKKISLSPSALNISLPRSLDHTIRAWMEIGIGLVGSLVIFERCKIRKFVPVLVAWLLLIGIEGLISGSNWGGLYHFGPGVVMGSIFFFSVLPVVWPYTKMVGNSDFSFIIYDRIKPLIFIASIMTVFLALRVVPTGDRYEERYWKPQPMSDIYRYVREIEQEFEGIPPEQVLLDIGNWIYLRHSVLAKDRAVSLADQPPAGIYDNINLFVDRIKEKTYSKILIRDLHSPFFFYDWCYWEKSSGVRKALLEYYTEIRTISAIEGKTLPIFRRIQAGPVSVLVPKDDS